jgi:squalene/oxidosqualene cyclase-like protein
MLAYVALRLLGLEPQHPLMTEARQWLHGQPGGVLANPSWGKLWLALLGLYDYRGLNPVPPELFLLPRWLPFHPRQYYCHTRYIYLGIAYLYGRRFQADLGPLRDALRQELYGQSQEAIDFASHRHDIAKTDLFVRPGRALRMAYGALAAYERWHRAGLRQRALDYCLERIIYEQRASRYQGLSPVNGLLNCLGLFAANHPELRPSLEGLESWKWEDHAEGIRYAGARSPTWDTAFAVQALLSNPAARPETSDALRRAYCYLRDTQLTEELPDYQAEARDPIRGGWCFSDGRHRWPVSDCTAEALDALLTIHETPGLPWLRDERLSDERLRWAVEFILCRQNADGGFGTYERRRGSALLEAVNPSEMYGQCMTELSYLECTGSALCALSRFRAAYPNRLQPALDRALARAVRYLRKQQRNDGSVPGFWGVNFTYGIFHVVKGLRAAGVPADDPQLRRAADWLVQHQKPDGGWGEHYRSCLADRYVEHPHSQVVMTSWALLALLEVLDPDAPPIARGVAWLRAQQRADGSWPAGAVNGVFFGTAMLDYRLYKSYFPTWALGRYTRASGGR